MISSEIIKIIYLLNAKANGWSIIYENTDTFYLIKEKNVFNPTNFSNEIKCLEKKPINLYKLCKYFKNT